MERRVRPWPFVGDVITADDVIASGACVSGVYSWMLRKRIDATALTKERAMRLAKAYSGKYIKKSTGNFGYSYGYGYGDDGDGDGDGDGYGHSDSDGGVDGHGDGYGRGYGDCYGGVDGYGYGNGYGYGDEQ